MNATAVYTGDNKLMESTSRWKRPAVWSTTSRLNRFQRWSASRPRGSRVTLADIYKAVK